MAAEGGRQGADATAGGCAGRDHERLAQVADDIRSRFGAKALTLGSDLALDAALERHPGTED